MKPYFSITVVFAALFVFTSTSFSFQTSSETVNPFNNYMSPSDGINLYSGDVAYSHPLAAVSGRGGMNIDLSLAYSSNIYALVRNGNDRAPTGWTGLGWRMGYGSIIRNHKGTKRSADDEFYWISPAGVGSRIVKRHGIKCYVYSGQWDSLPDFSTLTPVDSSITSLINLQQHGACKDTFGLVMKGMVRLDGTYTFSLTSDDGSRLYIDDNLIVSNNGIHACTTASAVVALSPGNHIIRVEYFQQGGETCLSLEYSKNGDPPRQFTAEELQPIMDMVDEVWDFGRYYIENDPYTRIEPVFGPDSNIIRWVVTATDGKKMYYGDDTGSAAADSSTRYTFAFGNSVGQGWDTLPDLFPSQWDLNTITDVAGNTLRFRYQQEIEALHVGTWHSDTCTPPRYYTKASYLKSIHTPEGRHVDFKLENKGGNEPFDPYRFENEPDGYIEQYESRRLKTIEVYPVPGSTVKIDSISFGYGHYVQSGLGDKYRKSYLTRITHFSNGKTGASTRFEYNTDFNSTDVNYHTGALCRIRDEKTGVATEFTYTRRTIPSSKTMTRIDTGYTRYGTYAGMTSDGNPYIVSRSSMGSNPRHIEIFNWTGSRWELKFPRTEMGSGGFDVKVYPLGDHVVLTSGSDQYTEILTWDGTRWYMSQSWTEHGTHGVDDNVYIYPGRDYIAFLSGENCNRLEICHWRNSGWVTTFPDTQVAGSASVDIYPNGNHIAIASGALRQFVDIYTFNGETWVKTLDTAHFETEYSLTMTAGNNFYALRLGGNQALQIITWNGTKWVTTFARTDISIPNYDFEMQGFNDHLVLRHGSDDFLQILSWTGGMWDTTFQRDVIAMPGCSFDFESIGPDYLSLRHGQYSDYAEMRHWNVQSKTWSTMMNLTKVSDGGHDALFYPGSDFIVFRGGADNRMRAYNYNGSEWFLSIPDTLIDSGRQIDIAAAGPAFGIESQRNNTLQFFYKFQDSFDTAITTFAVTQKKVKDPVVKGGTALTVAYDYHLSTNAMYDTRAGTAKFNKVDVITPGAGRTRQYFFNDAATQATINAHYDELDGMVYKTENISERGIVLDSAKSTYELFQKPYWPPIVKQKRVRSTRSWQMGVESGTDLFSFNEWNGLPQISRTANSDGTQKFTRTYFAFDHPSYKADMSGELSTGKYMLTVPWLTMTYVKAAGDSTVQWTAPEVRSAQIVTYSKLPGCNVRLPNKNYRWNTEYNPDGTPVAVFTSILDNPTISHPDWKFTGSTDRYDIYGGPVQTTKAGGIPSTVIMSADNTLPLMSVEGGRYGDCVFTDWAQREPPAVSVAHAAMSTAAADLHFAPRTLKLTTDSLNPSADQFAVAAVTAADDSAPQLGGRSFIVQFWAKGDRSFKMFLHLQALPGLAWSDYKYVDVSTAWRNYEITVTFPAATADRQYRLVLRPPQIPEANYTAGTVYYDDIRVTPVQSLSTVNYYDPVWRKPALTLDANNNPGTKLAFDDFGRPVQWNKLDPLKSAGETGYATLVQKKKYHLRNELPEGKHIQVLYPDGGEDFINTQSLNIQWINDSTRYVVINYKIKTGNDWGDWISIRSQSDHSGFGSFDWKIPNAGTMPLTLANECKIRVHCGTDSTDIDSSDAAFFLSTPAEPIPSP